MRSNRYRIPWDQFFMIEAVILSTRSTCLRRHVGAVLVKDNRIIASGYNGSVSGDVHCTDVGCLMVNGHCKRTVDAEQNCLTQCAKFGEATNGATIYVTDFPCLRCTKLLIQSGIKQINYLRNYHDSQYAKHLIKLRHIKLCHIKFSHQTIGKIMEINWDKYSGKE